MATHDTAARPSLGLESGIVRLVSYDPAWPAPFAAESARLRAALVRAGWVHRGEQGIPGREFFRRGEPRAYIEGKGAFVRDVVAGALGTVAR